MRTLIIFICFVFYWNGLLAQVTTDSLWKIAYQYTSKDTNYVLTLTEIANEYRYDNPDSSLLLAQRSLRLATNIHYLKGQGRSLRIIGIYYRNHGKLEAAIKALEESVQISAAIQDRDGLAFAYNSLAAIYKNLAQTTLTIEYAHKALQEFEKLNDRKGMAYVMNNISEAYKEQGNYEKALNYAEKGLFLSKSLKDKKMLFYSYANIGEIYYEQKKYDRALDSHLKNLQIAKEQKDNLNKTYAYNSIGESYLAMKSYDRAYANLEIGIQIAKSMNNPTRLAILYTTLAKYYRLTNQFSAALAQATIALQTAQSTANVNVIGMAAYEHSYAAEVLNKHQDALKSFKLHKQMIDSLQNEKNYRQTLQKEFEYVEKKRELLTQQQQLAHEIEIKEQKTIRNAIIVAFVITIILSFIGYYVYRTKIKSNLLLALQKQEIENQHKQLELSYQHHKMLSEIGSQITSTLDLTQILNILYENIARLISTNIFGVGFYDEARQEICYELAIGNGKWYKSSARTIMDKNQFAVWCIENRKEIFINDIEIEYQKYLAENMNEVYESVKLEDDTTQQPLSLIYLPLLAHNKVLGVITVQSFNKNAYSDLHKSMLRTLAIYFTTAIENSNAFKQIDEQKGILENQRAAINEAFTVLHIQNKDIIDSINAARQIQEAMLPSSQQMNEFLDHFFILYKPRDIVSGDFYWFAEVARSSRTESFHQILIVADCTGHGVPGAFMSLVGYNLLNDIIKARENYLPDVILTELDTGIKKALQQTEKGGREGMDIGVVGIEKQGGVVCLHYAGAMNSLYYVKQGQFYEIKGNKNSVGGEDYKNVEKVFTLHTVEVANTSPKEPFTFYLCTDGYQDQFGGEKGKKFMTKQLKETLFQMYYLDMSRQYQILDETFEDWKGKEEQVDDVTIIGVKL